MNLTNTVCDSWIQCIIFVWIFILKAGYACNFPSNWKDKAFRDSTNSTVKENIYFYANSVLWITSIHGTSVMMWDCHDSNTEELVIKGTQTVTHNSQTYYAYQCLLYTNTNGALFYYFPVKNVTDSQRVVLSTNPSLSICDVCSSIEPELHTMSLQSNTNCDCTPSCSTLSTTGSCSQSVDLSNIQCTTTQTTDTATTTTTTTATSTTSAQGSTASQNNNTTTKKSQTETVFTVEVIIILCASLFVLCLILVTSTVAIVIYNRNEQLRRRFVKIRKVRPAEHV
ncbi:dual specificity protein kinase splB-like [Ostrea edulis]|uniref:dual specificity protein kinase splB-like n=1 Tax=Ostrea edulis TaxID=37623 RepID=UPI002095FA9E|nr:dual specificity protein kinase splB-like [Ostrea edulis]